MPAPADAVDHAKLADVLAYAGRGREAAAAYLEAVEGMTQAEGRELRRLARAVPRQLAQATGCSADELTALTTRLQQLRSQLQGVAAPELGPGEIGFITAGIKAVADCRVGDTITTSKGGAVEALPGYKEVQPVVFEGSRPDAPQNVGGNVNGRLPITFT